MVWERIIGSRSQLEEMGGLQDVQGRRIRWHLLLSGELLQIMLSRTLLMAIWMNLLTTSSGLNSSGFLSISCGSAADVKDGKTGLEWVTDVNSTFIKTGSTGTFQSKVPQYINGQSLQDFRFFPERRNKYCYELPTTPNTKYLVRAAFYLDSQSVPPPLILPIQFLVSINSTNVFSMHYSADTPFQPLNVLEGIFYSPGSVLFACLEPVVGVPFIASLELRPLPSSMYAYSGSDKQFLANLFRYNIGAPSTTPLAIRYPDDIYDRFWFTPPSSWVNDLPIVSSTPPPDRKTRGDVYSVPAIVMQDAWFDWEEFWVAFDLLPVAPVDYSLPDYAYVVVYAEKLDASSSAGSMSVALDGVVLPVVNVSDRAHMVVNPNAILSSNVLNISLTRANGSPATPIMNAVEIYFVNNFNFSTTTPPDDEAITALKESFSLTDWQGDPCTPLPHDWLSCSLISTAQRHGQPCSSGGSSTGQCIAQQGFLRSIFYVTALNLSNVPTGGFILLNNTVAKSPDTKLNSLTEMSITNSGMDEFAFQFLVNNFSGGALTILDFSNNAISSIPASDLAGLENLVFLNLSRNLLAGELNSFENATFIASLETLDLSYNSISSLPAMWQNTTKTLVVLDLSHNQLEGKISSLDPFVELNAVSLQNLYVSDNNFSGTLSSSLYFSALPNLKIANFDRNSIEGTLDLSAWLDALQEAASGRSAKSGGVTNQVFSFVNNSISNIVPNANAFQTVMKSLQTMHPHINNSGILLGGNPYCNGAKSEIQEYLCRFTLNDEIKKKESHKVSILIIAICTGVVALLLFCAVVATMWKLWKQVISLRKIQQALASQKVQPPFYQYSDLRLATRDFHRGNKLGQGAFGVIYKGVLPDKTSLAVKKLFNSQNLQVMNEFLNEVVLITGIKHRNLVQLKGCCIKDKQRMLVYEYVENGNLAEALWGSQAHGDLNWKQRFNVCVGVARGLSYLHEELQPSIIHRDIKPENILLDKKFQPKIADFGLARHYTNETSQAMYTQTAGTLGYFSPEYATQGQLSNKADIYSYGVVVLEIISGRKCIDHSLPLETKFLKDWVHRMHKKGLLFDVLQLELRDRCVVHEVIRALNIGLLCVQQDPERRPSMSQVVTMFLGSMDVEVCLEESYELQSNTGDFFDNRNHQIQYPGLQPVMEEDFSNFPLLDLDYEPSSSSTIGSTRASTKPIIQMSSLVGR